MPFSSFHTKNLDAILPILRFSWISFKSIRPRFPTTFPDKFLDLSHTGSQHFLGSEMTFRTGLYIIFGTTGTGSQHIFMSSLYGVIPYFMYSWYGVVTYFQVSTIRGHTLFYVLMVRGRDIFLDSDHTGYGIFWSDNFPLPGPVFP